MFRVVVFRRNWSIYHKSRVLFLLLLLLEETFLSVADDQIKKYADPRARRTEDMYEKGFQTVAVDVNGDKEEFANGAAIFQHQFSDTQTINGIHIQVNLQVQIGVVTVDGGTPRPNPTRKPTPPPTANPTLNPTPNPTPNPTRNPTPNPTRNPTPNPTRNPTLNPTPNPTRQPTTNPTLFPTPSPPCEKRSDACDNPNADGFQFCLGFNTDLNGRINEFEKSAARWERIIDDFPDTSGSSVSAMGPFEECTCGIPDVIDDVQICILEEPLEDLFAFATPVIRTSDGTTILATMTMDPLVAIALDQVRFNDIMTTFIGFLLQLITQNTSENVNALNEYVGQEGLNVWQNDWGFGPGTSPPLVGTYWDSNCMPGEIMGSSISEEPKFISELTVAALKDFNYPIRPNATAEVIDEELILNRTNCPDPTNRRLGNLGRSDDSDHIKQRRLENRNRVYPCDVPILNEFDLPMGFNDIDRFNKIREKANGRLLMNLDKVPKQTVVDDLEYVAHKSLVAAAYDDDGSVRFLMFVQP